MSISITTVLEIRGLPVSQLLCLDRALVAVIPHVRPTHLETAHTWRQFFLVTDQPELSHTYAESTSNINVACTSPCGQSTDDTADTPKHVSVALASPGMPHKTR
jgi:hypothetical protein